MARKEWFAINCITRKAVIINADGLLDAHEQAQRFIGPETQAHQIGVTPRPRPVFDRFLEMETEIVFDVPNRFAAQAS